MEVQKRSHKKKSESATPLARRTRPSEAALVTVQGDALPTMNDLCREVIRLGKDFPTSKTGTSAQGVDSAAI